MLFILMLWWFSLECLYVCWVFLGGFELCLLEWFSFMFYLIFKDIFVGFFGITHPWIGKKWPCMGEGLYVDPNSVESLLMTRRGKEGRVLWAPTCHHIPCFEIVKFEEVKE